MDVPKLAAFGSEQPSQDLPDVDSEYRTGLVVYVYRETKHLKGQSSIVKEVVTGRSILVESWVDCLVQVRRAELSTEQQGELPDYLVMGNVRPFFKYNGTILIKCNASFNTHLIAPFNDIAPPISFFQIRQFRDIRVRRRHTTLEVLFRETPKDPFCG